MLKKITRRKWAYLTFGAADWAFFVWNIPSDLTYPYTLLITFLGVVSPFFWYKALDIPYTVKDRDESGQANAPTARNSRVIRRSSYLFLGAVSWGFFVSHIPPHPILNPRPVLTALIGFISPFFGPPQLT